MFKSSGILRYEFPKLILEIDQDIVDFYLSLIPKSHYVTRQKYGAHISVIRKEIVPNMDLWKAHEFEKIEFVYDPTIHFKSPYYWINAYSKRLEEIRSELGLSNTLREAGPFPYDKTFHMTIGNIKIFTTQ